MKALTAADFKNRTLRGFNLSVVHSAAELKAKNLPACRATGANLGRYWISVKHDASDVYSFTTPDQLTTLDAALTQAESLGMYLMVTLQVFPDQGGCDLWGNARRKAGVVKIWRQIAERYKGRSSIAGFDLINEPRPNASLGQSVKSVTPEFMTWQIDLITAIRSIDPTRVCVVEVLGNSMLNYITPLALDNVIYSPHGYGPLKLTHQGVAAYLGQSGNSERQTYGSGYAGKYDDWIMNYFFNPEAYSSDYWRAIYDFVKRNGYKPAIWIGEFACINWAPMNLQKQWTATRWTQDIINIFEREGWSWAFHAWREWQGWDPEIPSSYYTKFKFTNAAPFTRSSKPSDWTAQRTSTSPTMQVLKGFFAKNPTNL